MIYYIHIVSPIFYGIKVKISFKPIILHTSNLMFLYEYKVKLCNHASVFSNSLYFSCKIHDSAREMRSSHACAFIHIYIYRSIACINNAYTI